MDAKDLLTQAAAALDAERAANAQQVDSLTAANAQLQAQLQAAYATLDPWAVVDKTGATDVTDAVQLLVNKGLPVPAGKYLIDAVKGLKVTGALKMDPNTVLLAKPNNAARYCIVDVDGGSVDGGQIIGDRDTHTFSSATSTDEWGYGLFLRNGAKASNVQVSKCTGDGVGVSGDHVELRNVASRFNRRQGMSVFASTGLRVYDSEFTDTSGAQNGPCAGVDFEPDSGSITDAKFYRCKLLRNRAGVLCWLRAEVTGTIDVELVGCTITNNPNGVWCRDAGLRANTITVRLAGCAFASNSGNSVKADAGSVVTVGDSDPANANTFSGGATLKPGIVTKYDIAQLNGGKAVVGLNEYP